MCMCVNNYCVIYYVQGSVTHTSGLEKPFVTVSWTSPPVGTGAITIGYAIYLCTQKNIPGILYENNIIALQVCCGGN